MTRMGNVLTQSLGRAVLRILGWKIEGTIPQIDKLVLIVAPHTSNWDFFIGIAAMLALRIDVNWLGKQSIFFWPVGFFFRIIGGIPVDRSLAHGVVEQVVALFKSREKMMLGLSPEGTRKKVERWKSGFYRIAMLAEVPILLVGFDYSKKVIDLGPMLVSSGDFAKDLEQVRSYYAGITAKYPEQFSLPESHAD